MLTQYIPAYNSDIQTAYNLLLGQTPMFVLGSLVAYLCSQSWDVWIFHKIRNAFFADHSYKWIWNNASTLSSQVIDTTIYISIAFGVGLGWFWQDGGIALTLVMIVGQYLLKAILAVLDTPFFYFFTRRHN